jgi:heterodisulfide reductase subunit A
LETLLGKVERGQASPETLPQQAVFLQCVAARDDKNPYCSAICCPTALKNALRLRALVPGGTVTVVHRNIVTPGIHLERLYRAATDAGVALRNLDPAFSPEPLGDDTVQGLRIRDALDGREADLPADGLVCSTPLRPAPGSADIAQQLGLRLDAMGFACGREPILPLSPHPAGVYLCGSARWPATVEQSMEQGRAAAVKAAAHARGGAAACVHDGAATDANAKNPDLPWTLRELLGLAQDPARAARIREESCSRCGRCAAVCPHGALVLPDGQADDQTCGQAMRVTASRCGACGSCAAVCPTGAACPPGEPVMATRARIREALKGTAL